MPLTGIKKLIPLYLYGIQTLSKIYKNFLENQKKVLNLRPNLVSDFGKGRPRVKGAGDKGRGRVQSQNNRIDGADDQTCSR